MEFLFKEVIIKLNSFQPAAPASWNLLEMWVLGLHFRTSESEAPGAGQQFVFTSLSLDTTLPRKWWLKDMLTEFREE